MTSYVRGTFTLNAHQKATVGDCKFSVINNDHMGWLKCDGSSKSKNEFYLLWRVIGYSFGGSGDNFNLPDARGTVPGVVGTGTDSNLSSFTYALGQQVGEYNHTLTINEMPSHTHGPSNVSGNTNGSGETTSNGQHAHDITDPGHAHSLPLSSAALTGVGPSDDVTQGSGYSSGSNTTGITINSNGLHSHNIGNTGGSNYHNNIQPTLPIGNMFIYCGRPTYPFAGFPYTENTQIL
jgi:microcystin-dependent protein